MKSQNHFIARFSLCVFRAVVIGAFILSLGTFTPVQAIDEEADLSVTKTHSGSFVQGGSGTYTITVTNNGPNSTTDGSLIKVTDILPVWLTATDMTVTSADEALWGVCDLVEVSCERTASLGVGSSSVFSLTVAVDQDSDAGVNNNVTVSYAGDSIPGNNSVNDFTEIDQADLVITGMTLTSFDSFTQLCNLNDPIDPLPNETFCVQVEVKNQGNADSGDVPFVDIYFDQDPSTNIDPTTNCPVQADFYAAQILSLAPLAAGASDKALIAIKTTGTSGVPADAYQMWAYVDTDCTIVESVEGNNSSSMNITVGYPVDVNIANTPMGTYYLPPSPTLTKNYPGLLNGPVKVISSSGMPILTSQRTFYGNSFNELMGYPADQFHTEYWFPWYDNVYMQTWILVGNPSATDFAEVEIYIGGQFKLSSLIPPNGRITPMFTGELNGPVRVVCTNCASYGGTIFASERSLYGDSFSEVMGYPDNQLTSEYWFPWYDNVYMQTWILVGNPSSIDTAYVNIYIGGAFQMSSAIPPDGRITPMFAGQLNGPVQVVSTTGDGTPTPLPIFASERSLYGTSFNEVMGYPSLQFTTEYSFPWYDNTGSMQTWILVGNPSATETAYVEIYIGGALQMSTSIPPNGRITPMFPANTGPVRVVSTTGAGTPVPIDIFTSERSLYLTSFNEVMGYAADQLTTEYWFTWYDNVYMQTNLLLSKP